MAQDSDVPSEDDAGAAQKKKKSAIGLHKEQLERLKAQQPEFFAYLNANDKVCPFHAISSDDASRSCWTFRTQTMTWKFVAGFLLI